MHLRLVFRDCEVARGAVAEELFAKSLPFGTAMSDADMGRVVEVIQSTEPRNNSHGTTATE